MVSFTNLPNELLILVMKNADTIDDALHLGRCSRCLYSLLDADRLNVMRSIILQSDTHEHDVRLCHFIDKWQAFGSKAYAKSRGWRGIARVPYTEFLECDNATSLCDEHTWMIVARWQGMRLLQDLYRHADYQSAFRDSYHLANFMSCETAGEISMKPETAPLPKNLEGNLSAKLLSWNFRHTRRFYRALTRDWLRRAVSRLAEVTIYPTACERNTRFDELDLPHWDAYRGTLQENLDVQEANEFIYEFLLCSAFPDITTVMKWVGPSDREHRYRWYLGHPLDSPLTMRHLFIDETRLRLDPIDIMELLLLSSRVAQNPHSQTAPWPKDKALYLRERGVFDDAHGIVEKPYMFHRTLLAQDIDGRQLHTGIVKAIQNYTAGLRILDQGSNCCVWHAYRKNYWTEDCRGKMFFEPPRSNNEIFLSLYEWIRGNQEGSDQQLQDELKILLSL